MQEGGIKAMAMGGRGMQWELMEVPVLIPLAAGPGTRACDFNSLGFDYFKQCPVGCPGHRIATGMGLPLAGSTCGGKKRAIEVTGCMVPLDRGCRSSTHPAGHVLRMCPHAEAVCHMPHVPLSTCHARPLLEHQSHRSPPGHLPSGPGQAIIALP